MRLSRYLPSAWWRKGHCPGELEPWELSPHSDALLTGSGLWPIKVSLYISQRWDQNRKRNKSLSASMLGRLHCNKIVKQAPAGKQQKNNKLQYAYQGLTKEKGPPSFRAFWQGSQVLSLPSKLRVQCFLQVLHCQRQARREVLSSQGAAAQCKQPLNGRGAFIQTSCD